MMNHTIVIRIRIAVLIFVLLLCLGATAALAAGAADVQLNGTLLTAADPYWKNGGGGSAADWNAFFDTSTSTPTLRLKDAVINDTNGDGKYISADGDLNIALTGNSSIGGSPNAYDGPVGIFVNGNLKISDGSGNGSGTLTIQITHAHSAPSVLDGIMVGDPAYSFTMESGALHIILSDTDESYGIVPGGQLIVNGGVLTVNSSAPKVFAVQAPQLTVTNGTFNVTANASTPQFGAVTIWFAEALITGGECRFTSLSDASGLAWAAGQPEDFRVTGGRVIVSGLLDAMYFDTPDTVVPIVTGSILVSENSSGAGMFVWDPSKGQLASNQSGPSMFRYVELRGYKDDYPQTGDSASLWLWLGVGLGALLLGGAAFVWFRRRK